MNLLLQASAQPRTSEDYRSAYTSSSALTHNQSQDTSSGFKMQLKPIFAATTLLASAVAAPPLFTRNADWANWVGWTVRDFTRNCTNPDICTYWFTVDTGSSTQACIIVDVASPATTHPWYNIPCQQVGLSSPIPIYFASSPN
jgi:hypothetical protein